MMQEDTFHDPKDVTQGMEEAAMAPSASVTNTGSPERNPMLEEILRMPGVEGAGMGRDRLGNDEVVVYLRDEEARRLLPASLRGIAVRGEVTGPIQAQSRLG